MRNSSSFKFSFDFFFLFRFFQSGGVDGLYVFSLQKINTGLMYPLLGLRIQQTYKSYKSALKKKKRIVFLSDRDDASVPLPNHTQQTAFFAYFITNGKKNT